MPEATATSRELIDQLQKRAEEHIRNGNSQAAIDELDRRRLNILSPPFKLKGVARLLRETAQKRDSSLTNLRVALEMTQNF